MTDKMDLLDKSLWARQKIFEAVGHAFQVSDALDAKTHAHPSVFSAAETFLDMSQEIDVVRGVYELSWRYPLLRLSIAIRLGEVCIGLIVPGYRKLIEMVSQGDAIPYWSRGCDRLIRRAGPNAFLFDHIFCGSRMGDEELTRKALSGNMKAMGILADAIFFEARHLRASLIHFIHENDILLDEVEQDGLEVTLHENEEAVEILSSLTIEEISELCALPSDKVFLLNRAEEGKHRYLIFADKTHSQTVLHLLRNADPI